MKRLSRHLIMALVLFLSLSWPAQADAQTVRLAICQILVIDGAREGNFRHIECELQEAEAQHAQIAIFPESSILGWENSEAHYLASSIPGRDSDLAQVCRDDRNRP